MKWKNENDFWWLLWCLTFSISLCKNGYKILWFKISFNICIWIKIPNLTFKLWFYEEKRKNKGNAGFCFLWIDGWRLYRTEWVLWPCTFQIVYSFTCLSQAKTHLLVFLSSYFQADSWCYHVNSWIKDRVVLITSWVPFRFNESILLVLKIKRSERAFPSQTEQALAATVVKSKHSLHRWCLLAATHPLSLKKCIFKFYSIIQCYLLI